MICFFQSLSKNDSQSSICGKPLQAGLAIYGCRDCGQDDTCVMCPECFNVSEHRNHNYKISTTEGNGFCDCGDPEAFTNFYMCKTHEELSKKEVSPEEVLATFPQDILVRSREVIKIVRIDFTRVFFLFKNFHTMSIGYFDFTSFFFR